MSGMAATILTLVLLSIWGIASKFAGDRLVPTHAMLSDGVGHLLVVGLVVGWVAVHGPGTPDRLGLIWGIVTGLSGATAMITLFWALRQERAALVMPIVSLSPVVVLLVAVLCGERLSFREWVGVGLAMAGLMIIVGPAR